MKRTFINTLMICMMLSLPLSAYAGELTVDKTLDWIVKRINANYGEGLDGRELEGYLDGFYKLKLSRVGKTGIQVDQWQLTQAMPSGRGYPAYSECDSPVVIVESTFQFTVDDILKAVDGDAIFNRKISGPVKYTVYSCDNREKKIHGYMVGSLIEEFSTERKWGRINWLTQNAAFYNKLQKAFSFLASQDLF